MTTCDWRLTGSLGMATTTAGIGTWQWIKLTNFAGWQSVLRGNPAGDNSNSTFISGMKLSMRLDLLYAQKGAYLQVFLVSPAKDYADFDPSSTPIDSMPRVFDDSSAYQTGKFNPEAVKVHKCWGINLTQTTMNGDVPTNGPFTPGIIFHRSYYKRLGWKVTSPIDRSWKDVDFDNLPYHQQLWLVGQVVTGEPSSQYTMSVTARFTTKQYD